MNFWETKTLEELTPDEWESLCDGCGLCCLNKLQDEEDDNAPVLLTRVVCRCYDIDNGGCRDYANRSTVVEGCMRLTPAGVAAYDWLPASCAYRLVYLGRPLPVWHPLISGSRTSVFPYGVHAYDPVVESDEIDLEDYIVGG